MKNITHATIPLMQQTEALTILKTGANVFLTGAPGSGKTYVLNQYIEYLKEHDISVAVTASTGIAATHVNGITIHSWSGIGIRKKLSKTDLENLEEKQYLHKRFEKTRVLIIDEISMLDGETLDTIDTVCRQFKRNPAAFGGMQVVLVGDFFQLPPVTKRDEKTDFAFHSKAWKSAKFITCYLHEQYRQEDDQLLSLLDQIRSGDMSPKGVDEGDDSEDWGGDDITVLADRLHAEFPDVMQVTKLFTHNEDVDKINRKELEKLSDQSEVFLMETMGKKNMVEKLIASCLSPEELILKQGAVVMCTKNNFEDGYVNGTLGEVISFDIDSGFPIIATNDGRELVIRPVTWEIHDGEKVLASITQVPLRLAWAITVHKSQGMSLDAAEIDLGRAFEYGQGYVALSRVRTLEGLRLIGFHPQALMIHPVVLERDKSFREASQKMQTYLKSKTSTEMKASQDAFITRVGGSLEKIDWKKRSLAKGLDKISTLELTRRLVNQKKSISDIARERELTKETVLGHIEKNLEKGSIVLEDILYLKPRGKKFSNILEIFQEMYEDTGDTHLSGVKNKLGSNVSYFDIQLARLFLEK